MSNEIKQTEKMVKTNLKLARKLHKKVVKHLQEYKEVCISQDPTPHLFIGNGGILNGVSREDIIKLFKVYGCISNLTLLPQKSFACVSFAKLQSAVDAVNAYTGYNMINDPFLPPAPLYFSYLNTSFIPQSTNGHYPHENHEDAQIDGLILRKNFIDERYEQELINYFYCDSVDFTMKHRSVKHFGYEFLYTTNNVDISKPLESKIPSICQPLLERITAEGLIDYVPDQLTVNQYLPGQGIPPHIDTHSAFHDGIVSLTLLSQVTMDFKNQVSVPMVLPRRSLLVMKGESRYIWTHGITPRKFDIVYMKDFPDSATDNDSTEHLTLKERGVRISLTFRKVRNTPCSCSFIEKCDSQAEENSLLVPVSTKEASQLEETHVNDVYEEIATHFSGTRHSPWPRVKDFLCNLEIGSLVADVGCGNGKYLGINPNVMSFGNDRSFNLSKICVEREYQVCVADCLSLPYRDNTFDVAICIAVIHHMSTEQRRLNAIKQLVGIVKPDGLILIYVWAIEQEMERKIFNKNDKYENVEENNCCENLNSSFENGNISYKLIEPNLDKKSKMVVKEVRKTVEVSKGRNQFHQQDLLIPWHLKNDENFSKTNKEEKVFHRFYHVFKKGELEELCSRIKNIVIVEIYFDRGNWCAVLKKKK